MFSDDEPELRDLIVQNLEKCGFLDKIKAELRAGVFLALEEDGNLKDKIPLFSKTLDDYARTSEGKIMLSLVREFLEFFNLNFTLSVFDPEVSSSTPFISRSELQDKFKLQNVEDKTPIISTLLKDIVGSQTQNLDDKSNKETKRKSESHSSVSHPYETVTGLTTLESSLSSIKIAAKDEKTHIQKNLDSDYLPKTPEEQTKDVSSKNNIQENILKDTTTETKTDIEKETNSIMKTENQINIFKESKDLYSLDHDSFFDEPVPSEKTLFSFSGSFKDKNEVKLGPNAEKISTDPKRSSLSSLRDLPSLGNNSWITNKDSKDNQQSLDILKSFTDSKSSNLNETDSKMKSILEKKDSDVIESNEESSEKQVSEESIEEEIQEDFSAGMEDLLNSSLSLAEDATTDQTVSQVSVVDGVDHVEPCNS